MPGICLRGEAGERTEVKGSKAFSQKLQQHLGSFELDSKHLFMWRHTSPLSFSVWDSASAVEVVPCGFFRVKTRTAPCG